MKLLVYRQMIISIAFCTISAQILCAPVKMKMYKNDPDTWNEQWVYGTSDSETNPGNLVKKFKKDTTISYESGKDQYLHVCTAGMACDAIKLPQTPEKYKVIIIDSTLQGIKITVKEPKDLLKFIKIEVNKAGDWNEWWTIKAMSPNGKVVYGIIRIKKDTSGPLTSRLRVPYKAPVLISVKPTMGGKEIKTLIQAQDKPYALTIDRDQKAKLAEMVEGFPEEWVGV